MDYTTTFVLLLSTALVYLASKAVDFRAVTRFLQLSKRRITLQSLSPFQWPATWTTFKIWLLRGDFRHYMFKRKYGDFADRGIDVIETVRTNSGFRLVPHYLMQVADPVVVKHMVTNRPIFTKPVELYEVLSFFGRNIIVSEGEEWKRFRKLSAPAFSEKNTRFVCGETVEVMQDLFDNVWGNQDKVVLDHALELTMSIALFVTSSAGFGKRISWNEGLSVLPGHKMTFRQALHTSSAEMVLKIAIPDIILKYGPSRLRKVKLAFEELELYLREMIDKRRDGEIQDDCADLFSNLLDANEEAFGLDGKTLLSDRELMGNVYIFLFAGHDTTSQALGFAFALLALYPEEQDRMLKEIQAVLPDGRAPVYEELDSLPRCLAVLYESLRMFPPVIALPKVAAKDTIVVTTNAEGQKVSVPVIEGTRMVIHVPALHNHPKYWKDPEVFNPDRFLGDWPREAFLPFSGGARSCLGRRFVETEGVVTLAMLIQRYKISITEDPKFAGETFAERKARILSTKSGITLSPINLPLTFTRR